MITRMVMVVAIMIMSTQASSYPITEIAVATTTIGCLFAFSVDSLCFGVKILSIIYHRLARLRILLEFYRSSWN